MTFDAGFEAGTGNLGGDGAGGFNGTVGGSDLNDFAGNQYFEVTAQPVPEPATLVLMGAPLAGLLLRRRKPEGSR